MLFGRTERITSRITSRIQKGINVFVKQKHKYKLN